VGALASQFANVAWRSRILVVTNSAYEVGMRTSTASFANVLEATIDPAIAD
jgi:hypothetical protein